MGDDQDNALPARSRKPVDDAAAAARQQQPVLGVDKLRDLQAAIEADKEQGAAD